MRIVRRVSEHPLKLGLTMQQDGTCPDVFELQGGDFLVIGRDVTEDARGEIPSDALISNGERAILVPRATVLSAVSTLAPKP